MTKNTRIRKRGRRKKLDRVQEPGQEHGSCHMAIDRAPALVSPAFSGCVHVYDTRRATRVTRKEKRRRRRNNDRQRAHLASVAFPKADCATPQI